MAGCVATIGFFDGVHRGHRFVIGCVAAEARRQGLRSVVVTFDRHPREVVAGDAPPPLLTSLADKRRLIVEAGADACEVLHFDHALAALPARDFMREVLRGRLGVEVLLIGYDNRFGHRDAHTTEGFDDYVAYGREIGIEVVRLPECPATADGFSVSSSAVRKALREGRLTVANACLGRLYSITGHVVHGYAKGRTLGFPTANLALASIPQLIPAPGVYAVMAAIGSSIDNSDDGNAHPAMLNIGSRPTFHGHELSVEAHIFDFDGDLYGQDVTLSFVNRIREERTFDSPETLRRQLEHDRLTAYEMIKNHSDYNKKR